MRPLLWVGVVGWSVASSAVWGAGQSPAVTAPKTEGTATVAQAPAMSEKQKKLIEDTEKLVKMAAELKVSVDKSSKNELSLDVVRKAEAVEKLAKSVKERIREAR